MINNIMSLPELYIWVWLGIFILALIIEAMTSDVVSIWFSVGALCSLILALCKVYLWIQVVVFVIVSILTLILTRPLIKRFFIKNEIKTNVESIVGQKGIITRDVLSHQRGEVKVGSVFWLAKSNDDTEINEGSEIEVLAVEGATLIVKKIGGERK